MGDSNQAALDREAYRFASKFLREMDGAAEFVEGYLSCEKAETKEAIYRRMLYSAQNFNRWPWVIAKGVGEFERLGEVLSKRGTTGRFEPSFVWRKCGNDAGRVLIDLDAHFGLAKKVPLGPRSFVPRYCRTITSAAAFLTEFASAQDFLVHCDSYDIDERVRQELTEHIAKRVVGLGPATTCDFLKEIGFLRYSKPDTHMKDVFEELRLSRTRSEKDVFEAIDRVANNVGTTPYAVDKVFWRSAAATFTKNVAGFLGARRISSAALKRRWESTNEGTRHAR